MAKVGVARNPEARKEALEQLQTTPGWLNLCEIAHASAPPSAPPRNYPTSTSANSAADVPDIPAEAYHDAQMHADDSEDFAIPPDDRDAVMGTAGAEGTICPHCTFENPAGATGDCEVCGLPLLG